MIKIIETRTRNKKGIRVRKINLARWWKQRRTNTESRERHNVCTHTINKYSEIPTQDTAQITFCEYKIILLIPIDYVAMTLCSLVSVYVNPKYTIIFYPQFQFVPI